MPELPEVETIRYDLAKFIIGKKIKAIKMLYSKSARNSASFFRKNLVGYMFKTIERRGKLLIFYINNDKYLIIHLKMTGQLIYINNDHSILGGHILSDQSFLQAVGGQLPNRFTRIIFTFNDNSKLFFNDLRKFAYLKIINEKELDRILKNNYGLEPLRADFTLSNFKKLFIRRRGRVKALLLNQRIIAGLGNIYCDESLFLSGIRPDRTVDTLSDVEIKKLYQAINRIIKRAIKLRGTTFKDYRDSKGKKGNFSNKLQVYGRDGLACLKCGEKIIKTKVAGRGTRYCPHCQN